MKLKEKFDNIEIMFEGQIGILNYDELYKASNHCVKIADDYAIDFAEWMLENYIENNDKIASTEKLLEIFKKEKGL
jgi:hypothetical protein